MNISCSEIRRIGLAGGYVDFGGGGPGATLYLMAANPLLAHFQSLARYNTLANQRLYSACAKLPVVELERERSGSFRSILNTLNHIMLGDRIWMHRFTEPGITRTPALNTILYADFGELHAARESEDVRIEAFVASLTDDFLTRELRYINSLGELHADPAALILAHLFNHQTHHRGQVHVMLSDAGAQPPSLDLHRALRPLAESAAG